MDLVSIEAQLFLLGLERLLIWSCGMLLWEPWESSCLYYLGELALKSLSCSKEFCCLILLFLNMLDATRWWSLLLPHCSLLDCIASPCLGEMLYKLHREYLIVWEYRLGWEDLRESAMAMVLAWEVEAGGREEKHSTCHAQIGEMPGVKTHKKGKAWTEQKEKQSGVKQDRNVPLAFHITPLHHFFLCEIGKR